MDGGGVKRVRKNTLTSPPPLSDLEVEEVSSGIRMSARYTKNLFSPFISSFDYWFISISIIFSSWIALLNGLLTKNQNCFKIYT